MPPQEEQLDDIEADERDTVYQHGLGIARQIQLEAAESGRRRHVSSSSQCGGQTDRKGNVNSITNSTSEPCRRRSNKSCCPSSCFRYHYHDNFHDHHHHKLLTAPADRHAENYFQALCVKKRCQPVASFFLPQPRPRSSSVTLLFHNLSCSHSFGL